MRIRFSIVLLIAAAVVSILIFSRYNRHKVGFRNGHCVRCNVILVSVESLRRDHMSLYGYGRTTTPVIDEWAKRALVFENYFSSSYLSAMSEGSVHTGMHPFSSGLIHYRKRLPVQHRTIAEILRGRGYRTQASGNSQDFFLSEDMRVSFMRGFRQNYYVRRRAEVNIRWNEIRKFIDEKKEPFFIWIPIGSAHLPFGFQLDNRFADEKYDGPFKKMNAFSNHHGYYDGYFYNVSGQDQFFKSMGLPLDMFFNLPKQPINETTRKEKASPADIKFLVDAYDNGVAHVDREFGALLELLRASGHIDDTVIVFQSESGVSLGEHGYIAQYDTTEEATHVPLLIGGPMVKSGMRVDEMVSGVDILPSLLDLLDVPSDGLLLDGKSLFANWSEGKIAPMSKEVFMTRTPLWEANLLVAGQKNIFDRLRLLNNRSEFRDYAIRDNRWKLTHRLSRLVEEEYSCWRYISGKRVARPEFEFYDIEKDKFEAHPLPPEGPDFERLKERLIKFEERMERHSMEALTPTQQIEEAAVAAD